MILQAIVFTVLFLGLSAFMVAISFHIYRFRYPHDSTGIVFITLTVIFILLTIMTYLLFDYSPQKTSSQLPEKIGTSL